MDNVKHKPAGGDKKVFNDVDYLRQMSDHHPGLYVQHSGNNSHFSSRRESGSQSESLISSRKSSSVCGSLASRKASSCSSSAASRKTSSQSQADSGIGSGGV